MVENFSFCENEVKRHDYERYLCCLLSNCYIRPRLFAIYAFNNEISKIKDIISEPMAGYIRLQWWREAIDEIYEGKPVIHRHEVVDSLYEVVKDTDIPKHLFHDIIDARESDIDFKSPDDMDDLGKYAIDTSSNLFYLLLSAAGVNCNTAKEAAYHAGIAYAIVGLMRSMRYNVHYGRVMFPKSLMLKAELSADDLMNGNNIDKSKHIVRALCDKAEINLHHTKALLKGVSSDAKSILLPTCIVDVFLKRIKKNDYDLFNKDVEGNIFSVQLKILKSRLLGGY